MTVFTNEPNNQRGEHNMNRNELPHIHHKAHGLHPHPMHPAHPYERRAMLRFSLDEKDREVLLAVFDDEDSAASAESIIYDAPSEVQILAIQALNVAAQTMHLPQSAVAENTQEAPSSMVMENRVRWSCPVLDESVNKLFRQAYGEVGYSFCTVLGSAPYEIAVVARILAYLNEKVGEINGHH